MNKKNYCLVMLAFLTLGLAACDDKTKTETTQKSDVNGTTVEKTTTTNTSVDNDGNRTEETKSKTTVDPDGLMNKQTHEEQSETKESH